MKTIMFAKISLGLALAAWPLVSGCAPQSADSAPTGFSTTNAGLVDANFAAPTNTPSTEPDPAEQQLEHAPGKVVATAAAPQSANLTDPANEIVKLAQAGVNEGVMLSFVTNSAHTFNLTSDAIIYLNDIGVADTVVTAMIQHDQTLPATGSNAGQPAAPGSAPTPYPTQESTTASAQPPSSPETPSDVQPPQTAVSNTYFYNSLAPYGNWINVEGYGMCWQPTSVVVNPDWQPYCDRGHWINSDCGWYWASDYSWGWAPFHYGRWFRHHNWGWCWMPDTVWAPSWVSWRYTDDYCGWAPLPAFGISFGWSGSVFVSIGHFYDRHPGHYRVPPQHVRPIFDRSTPVYSIEHRNGRVMNKGIPVSRIAAATHTNIRVVAIRDAKDPVSARGPRGEGNGRILPVYRPNLTPSAHGIAPGGEGSRFGSRNGTIPQPGMPVSNPTRFPRGTVNSSPHERATETVPIFRNPPSAAHGTVGADPSRNVQTLPSTSENPQPVQRGPERAIPSKGGQEMTPRGSSRPTINPTVQPPAPARNFPVQTPSRGPQAQAPAPGQIQSGSQNPNMSRQEQPKLTTREERVFSQPSTPVQRQPAAPTYQFQTPRAAESREQPRSFSPPPERSQPVRVEPAPRMETRQPQQAPAASHGGDRNSKSDDSSRRNH